MTYTATDAQSMATSLELLNFIADYAGAKGQADYLWECPTVELVEALIGRCEVAGIATYSLTWGEHGTDWDRLVDELEQY